MVDKSKTDGRRRVSDATRTRAKRLREEATIPERFLWSRLRAKELGGVKFRRQHPIEPYIVDSYCPSTKLAIELDGRSHEDRDEYDARRTRYLESLGIRVIRFSDDEILNNLDDVVRRIAFETGLEN